MELLSNYLKEKGYDYTIHDEPESRHYRVFVETDKIFLSKVIPYEIAESEILIQTIIRDIEYELGDR